MTIKTTKYDIIAEYDKITLNHNISSLNKKDFHQFINGLYQAEGTMGAYFYKYNSLAIRLSFSIGQNYSAEALNVFLNLQKILGVGKVKLEFDSKDKPNVRYTVNNTKEIIFKVLPYFSLLYGQKNINNIIVEKIYKLSIEVSKEIKPKVFLISEFINLVYSIYSEGRKRKLSLTDKLAIFNCSSLTCYNNIEIEENNNLPSELFIIGLFLSKGNLRFVFDAPLIRTPKFLFKIVFNFSAQSNNNSNIELLVLCAKRMNLKPQIYIRKSGMIGLQYTGETVLKSIMPFLAEYQDWLFWKKNQFINAQKIIAIIKNNDHLTKKGLKQIVNLLYDMPNKNLSPKEFWMDLIDKRLWK